MKKLILSTLFLAVLLLSNCGKEERDPCEGIVCVNGGECINGTCECPENWEGADCSQQKTPSAVVVTSIRVTQFPFDNNGISWDVLDRADLFVEIVEGERQTSPRVLTTGFIEDVMPDGTYNFNGNNTELDPNTTYGILLYDHDDFSDPDYMGGFVFQPYNNQNGFPESLLIGGDDIKTEIFIEYKF